MFTDTIAAVSTPPGIGGLAVIRISGPEAFSILEPVFHSKKRLSEENSHTTHFGKIKDGERVLDEVLVTVFRGPASFTGEDTLEISCHGSLYIQEQILQLLIRQGAGMAKPGEFSLRAYLNRKLDLSQAEAIGDLIAADSEAAHRTAMQQMRGGYSAKIGELRDRLVEFASLIELELDFSEEDVEFADRTRLTDLLAEIRSVIKELKESFRLGNVIREGIPVAIAGAPNAGKSTLLNALLKEERALVSEVAGTTRDTVEEEIVIEGYKFRFIDTAGIRETADRVESMGIERTFRRLREARIVVYLFDPGTTPAESAASELEKIKEMVGAGTHLIVCATKADLHPAPAEIMAGIRVTALSAPTGSGLQELTARLMEFVKMQQGTADGLIVTNARHFEALHRADLALETVERGFEDQLTGDLIAVDLRVAIHALGEITGEISADDLLGSIFSKFCIGK